MTPHCEGHGHLSFLPVTSSSQSETLKGPFELTQHTSRTLNLASCIALELHRNNIISCAAIGVEVPGLSQEKLTQTLIVFFSSKNIFAMVTENRKLTEKN